MREPSNIDFEGLAAFVAGECSEADQRKWEQWINASAENRKVYEDCLRLMEPVPDISVKDRRFDSNAAWERVEQRIGYGKAKTASIKPMSVWLKYAAAFLLAGLLITYLVITQLDRDITIQQTSGVELYYLPDSSTVTLSGNSSVTYSAAFDQRDVRLTGQAFFNVGREEGKSFTVHTGNAYVKVLGTAFMVRESEDSIQVTVEHGLVELGLENNDQRVQLSNNEEGLITIKDQKLVSKELENTNKLFWANKQLIYRQATLAEVFDELERLFGKQFIYESEMVNGCQLTAVFRDQAFDQILRNIAVSVDLEYEISGDQITITRAGCE